MDEWQTEGQRSRCYVNHRTLSLHCSLVPEFASCLEFRFDTRFISVHTRRPVRVQTLRRGADLPSFLTSGSVLILGALVTI